MDDLISEQLLVRSQSTGISLWTQWHTVDAKQYDARAENSCACEAVASSAVEFVVPGVFCLHVHEYCIVVRVLEAGIPLNLPSARRRTYDRKYLRSYLRFSCGQLGLQWSGSISPCILVAYHLDYILQSAAQLLHPTVAHLNLSPRNIQRYWVWRFQRLSRLLDNSLERYPIAHGIVFGWKESNQRSCAERIDYDSGPTFSILKSHFVSRMGNNNVLGVSKIKNNDRQSKLIIPN